MASQDLTARLEEITVAQLTVIHTIDMYPVDGLTPVVMDQDPSEVCNWIRAVAAPFDELKKLINTIIARPGFDKAEAAQLNEIKLITKEKVHKHRASLKAKAAKYR